MSSLVNTYSRNFEHILGSCLTAAAQDRIDTGDKDLRTEGLGYILIDTELESEELIPLIRSCGKHDDRHLGELSDFASDLPAVHLRHHNVQNYKGYIFLIKEDVNSFLAVFSLNDLIVLLFKEITNKFSHPCFIVYDHYF